MRLTTQARLSMLWTALSRVGIQVLQLVTFVITAQWLSPAEYGTYAIVMLVVTLLVLFNDFGLQAAIVHDESPSKSKLSTAFWLNVAVGLVFTASIALLAIPAGMLLDYPDIERALVVASIAFAVSVTVVPSALLQRTLRLGTLAAIEFGANFCGSAVVIFLAWKGFGVVSLSFGPVATALLITVTLSAVTRFRPRGWPTLADLRSLWNFSASLLGTNVSYYVFRNVDVMALTATSSAQLVGIYSRAYSLVSAPVTQAGAVIGRVLFPILARSQGQPSVMRERWLRTTYASFGILLPVSVSFAFVAPYVVRVFFEPRWYGLATIISILSLAVPARLLCNAMGPVYQATGNTTPLFRVTLVQGAALIAGVGIGTVWGPEGVAWGVVVATNLAAYVPISVGLKFIRMRVSRLLFSLRRILLAAACQCVVMAVYRLSGGADSDWISLGVCLGLGLGVYLLVGRVSDRDFFGKLTGRAS